MLGLGKTATVRDSAGVSPASSQKIYRHYAVALYRQALLDRADPARAGHVGIHPGQRRAGIHPRGMAGLLRVVLRRLTTPPAAGLGPAGHNVIYIGNPATGVRGILAAAVTALGGKPAHGTAGRTPVLIIDEAHLLDHEQLEAVRLMTNHEMDSSTPFATILVGQPTLRHHIKLGVLAALDQRITVSYQMKGMTGDETASYIRHHLEEAGRTADLFTDDAVTQIHTAARGKPRTVNNICLAALIATAGVGKNLVDHAAARAAIAEITATD